MGCSDTKESYSDYQCSSISLKLIHIMCVRNGNHFSYWRFFKKREFSDYWSNQGVCDPILLALLKGLYFLGKHPLSFLITHLVLSLCMAEYHVVSSGLDTFWIRYYGKGDQCLNNSVILDTSQNETKPV